MVWYLLHLAARKPGIALCPELEVYSGQTSAGACVGACVNLGKKGGNTGDPSTTSGGSVIVIFIHYNNSDQIH